MITAVFLIASIPFHVESLRYRRQYRALNPGSWFTPICLQGWGAIGFQAAAFGALMWELMEVKI